MLETMDTLPQLLFLLQSVLLSQSKSVTRSPCPPQERLAEPCVRPLLTSPPLRASKSPPRLPTALLLLVMTPRLDQLRLLLMPLLLQLLLLPQLPQLLLDMVVMASVDTPTGNQFLHRLAHQY